MTELNTQQFGLCDIQGRLFELALRKGYNCKAFIEKFMNSKTAAALDERYDRLQWAGEEYDKQRAKVLQNAGELEVAMSLPLLWDDTDLGTMTEILKQAYPMADDTVLVAMGHGTEHLSNSLYVRLAELMADKGMILCTVEGKPDFEDAVEALKAQTKHKAHLVPLLLVAGDHSKNDMAGEEPDSLRRMLEQAGIQVDWTLQGLGELPAVQKMYVHRAAVAYNTLQKRGEV